jgi:hypothetical protein
MSRAGFTETESCEAWVACLTFSQFADEIFSGNS